jgi:hypothetical protein
VFSFKALGAFLGLLFLTACASLSGKEELSLAAETAEHEEAIARADALELEVNRLKSENARLASMLLDLQRDVDRQKEAKLPPKPEIKVPNPQPQAKAVVDDAKSPELAKADVPIESSPRLVQPEFASTETVFENEADEDDENKNGEIKTASVLFGVHLASYRHEEEAREGWRKLQRENPDELGLLEPRIEKVNIQDKGEFLRLVGGGFSSEEKAQALCVKLKQSGLFCSVVGFEGKRLSLGE